MIRSAALILISCLPFGVSRPAAGPPLVCFGWDIGGAKSLPWGAGADPMTPDLHYDSARLATDACAALDASDDPIVHAETLRRAALYASRFDAQKKQRAGSSMGSLVTALMDRALRSSAAGRARALDWLDAALLYGIDRECARMLQFHDGAAPPGREFLERALALDGGAELQLLAAAWWLDAPEGEPLERSAKHLAAAEASARPDSSAARNAAAFRERFAVLFAPSAKPQKQQKEK